MIGTLAKLKEICEWWKERYDYLYAFVEAHGHVEPDYYVHEIKQDFAFECSNFSLDIYTIELIDLTNEAKATAEYMPPEVKAAYWELHAEMLQIIGEHIRKIRDLRYVVESEDTNYKQIEYCIDSSYDYFLDRFDALKGAMNCLKSNKSIREILNDEDTEQTAHLKALEYRQKIINTYKQALDDISGYLTDDIADSPSRIRCDIGLIINQAHEAVNNLKI